MPGDDFHLGILLFLGLAGAAALTIRAYQEGTRNFAALLFCVVMGFSGPVIGVVAFAPVMQAAWHSLWSGAFTLPGLVSMRGEFLVLGWLIGTTITALPALIVTRRHEK